MLDAVTKQKMANDIRRMYSEEGCGICEKKGADVFWFSQFSRGAHTKCYQDIQSISEKLLKAIDGTYKDNHQKVMAHIRAIGGIRRACGSDSISAYLEKNGHDALQRLFDTVGVYCAKVPPARL